MASSKWRAIATARCVLPLPTNPKMRRPAPGCDSQACTCIMVSLGKWARLAVRNLGGKCDAIARSRAHVQRVALPRSTRKPVALHKGQFSVVLESMDTDLVVLSCICLDGGRIIPDSLSTETSNGDFFKNWPVRKRIEMVSEIRQ